MARGNGSRIKNVPLYIPVELDELIELYMIKYRLVSKTGALRSLLESHPTITHLAAELIQLSIEGTTPAKSGKELANGYGNSPLASVFLGYVCGGQVSYSRRDNAFRGISCGARSCRHYGGLTNGSIDTANRAA